MGSNKKIPDWVLAQRKKGTEIHRRGDTFYLCKVSSVWDKKLKRSRKITGEYLGKITKEGIVPPKQKQLLAAFKQVTVKEYGASRYLRAIVADIEESLKRHYPQEYKELFVFSALRLLEQTPLKRFGFYYQNSYLSEVLPDVKTSIKFLCPFLRDIGSRRDVMTAYMKEFLVGSEFAAIDLSEIFTYSEGVNAAMLGHNHKSEYIPQINLALVFSLDKTQPGFFRMIPGSIRDVSSVVATVQELDLKEIVFIGDKGFSSEKNARAFSAGELKYIIPLKRNSTLIDYDILKRGSRKEFDGVFSFDKRHIWHYTQKEGNEQIITFLDEKLKAEENTKKIEGYQSRVYEKDYMLGTIAVRTTCGKSAQEVYGLLKSRMDIEKAFDVFKNILESDRNYMRDDKQLEGFLFVSFIALQFYYRIYGKLIEKELLNNYSVPDVIEYLKRVHLLKIKGKTQFAEIPKKSRKLIEKLEYVLPEEPITKKG
jgi:transposase